MNIRLVTGELLLDPNRVQYMQICVDVEISIYVVRPKNGLTRFTFRRRFVRSRMTSAFLIYSATWLVNEFSGPLYGVRPQAYGMRTARWWDLFLYFTESLTWFKAS